jgi:HlyD family type I secretion membrane fusion protein
MSVQSGSAPLKYEKIAPADRAFLPAALEIVDTPASPTIRLTGMLICLFLVIVVAWSSIGQVDLIATAPGKVVPVGRTKQVQVFETGVIRQILVDDGTPVVAGQTLVVLDPTLAVADRDRFKEQAMRADLDLARLNALINAIGTQAAPAAASADPFADIAAPPEAISDARGRFAADRAGRDAKLAAADREIASKRAERAEDEAEIAKIDATLPLVQERAQIRKSSSEQKWGSRIDYLTAAQAEAELTNQRKVMLQKAAAADAAIQAQIADRQRIAAETERDWRTDLEKAARDKAEASSELAKA